MLPEGPVLRQRPLPGVQRIAGTLTLDLIQDGGSYRLPPDYRPEQTNLFFHVGRAGQLFVKVPTGRGLADYRTFIRDAQTTEADIRPLEDAERFEHLPATLQRVPGLAPIADTDPECAHYLAVHWLQYDRLRTPGLIGIPEARFATINAADAIVLNVARPGSQGRDLTPAIFQQRVPGATLWDMFDFEGLRLRASWLSFKSTIAAQLSALLESHLVDHIDWNIRNFVFHGAEQRLYYVDSKPTMFVARASNDLNLSGIRTHFLS